MHFFTYLIGTSILVFENAKENVLPTIKIIFNTFLQSLFLRITITINNVFYTCPSVVSNFWSQQSVAFFNNLLLLQIFKIFMQCWMIRSVGELGHFKTCQFHDYGPQQVNIQLWSSSSWQTVFLLLHLWKLRWCNLFEGITIWKRWIFCTFSKHLCISAPRTHFCKIFISNVFCIFFRPSSKLQTCFVLCTSMMITFFSLRLSFFDTWPIPWQTF